MGRIEEALRRAADERARPAPPVVTDAASLTAPFPEEHESDEATPESVAASPVQEPVVVTPAPVAHIAVEDPAGAPPPVADEPDPTGAGTLLSRLDVGLAEKVVIDSRTTQVSREQYRKLAATLHQAQAVSGLKVVMMASAVAGEGKTLTSSNLALTLSESYRRRVLLVDADLRRPSLHSVFRVDGMTGLSEGLGSPVDRRFPVHQVSPFLTVLPAGRPTADPMAGLTSDRMRRLIQEARANFDWVIVDTPPVGLLPDGHLLTAMVDGAILVVKAGETPYPVIVRAIESLGRDRVLGVVLNQAMEASTRAYYHYKYDYGSRPEIART
jgi:capsular exopolysaccharide synthesis family protein